MKKLLFLTALLCQLFCPLPSVAQENRPSRAEQLIMKDNLLVLWSMGLTKSSHVSLDTLCRDALFFLILSEGSVCGLDRGEHPSFFQGISEKFRGYIPKDSVEEIARTIFGQEISRHKDFEGVYFDGNGYFLDFSVLSDKTGNLCNLSADDFLPGYANVEVMDSIGENAWEVFGSLRRFKEVDGEEIIWKEAWFYVTVQYQDGKLQLKSFEFTEQAMG